MGKKNLSVVLVIRRVFRLITAAAIIYSIILWKGPIKKRGDLLGWSNKRESYIITVENETYNQAVELWNQMDYKNAEMLFREALNIEQTINGNGSNEAAAVSMQLGRYCLSVGKLSEAYDYLTSAYVAFRNNLGDEDINTVMSKCLLSEHAIKSGNAEQGFKDLSAVYEDSEYVKDKLLAGRLLAECYLEIGNYRCAYEWYDKLGRFYKGVGISTEERGKICNDIGRLYNETGKYYDAVEALEFARGLDITDKKTMSEILINLAVAYTNIGKSEQAFSASEQAIQGLLRTYEEDNIYIADAYENLAKMYAGMKKSDKQLECLGRALDICLAAAGPNCGLAAQVYGDYGDYYYNNEQYDLAIENHNKALEIRKNLLGIYNEFTAALYEQLSFEYLYSDKTELSLDAAERAVEICSALYGRDHPHTAYAFAIASVPCMRLHNAEKAEQYISAATEVADRHLSDQYLAGADIYNAIGAYYKEISDNSNAEKYILKANLIYRKLCGNTHIKVARSYTDAGDFYLDRHRFDEASKAYKSAYDIYSRLNYETEDFQKLFGEKLFKIYKANDTDLDFDEWLKIWTCRER